MHAARARHLSAVEEHTKSSGDNIHFSRGAWLYGDYKNAPGVSDPVSCAKACETDEGCYHWNFHVLEHECDLKADNGGHDSDKADWIFGHSSRWFEAEAEDRRLTEEEERQGRRLAGNREL